MASAKHESDGRPDAGMPPEVDAESWRGFERRIQARRLRVLTETIRGGATATRVQMESMQAALDEVRALSPDNPELAELESITRAALGAQQQQQQSSPSSAPLLIAAATVMIICGGAGLTLWGFSRGSAPAIARATAPVATPAAARPVVVRDDISPALGVVATAGRESVDRPVVEPASARPPVETRESQPPVVRAAAIIAEPPVRAGWLEVSAPLPLEVRDGSGRTLGTSGGDRIALPPGRHEVQFVSASTGFSSQQTVLIRATETTTASVTVPTATIAINATPWAEVWIDGRNAGETPIGELTTTVGEHQLEFRHPRLGTRRITAHVTAEAPARVAIDMTK